jgi:hypothetical protein
MELERQRLVFFILYVSRLHLCCHILFIFCVIKNPQDAASACLLVTVHRRNGRNIAGRTVLDFRAALTLNEVILFALS